MADLTIAYTEEMVGSGHPTKSDTLNRLALVEHNTDGTHKGDSVAKAWATFNGTATAALLDSYHVTSLTDNDTGDYSINLSTAAADGNYTVGVTVATSTGGATNVSLGGCIKAEGTSTAACRVVTGSKSSGGLQDMVKVCVVIFGG